MSHAPATNPDPHAKDDKHAHHGLRLWPFFLALLALTAAEVGLYEYWKASAHEVNGVKEFFIPKFALVWLILVFTLPKAYIVLVYFMHIRFEKQIIVWLAVIPLMLVFVCVLPTLTDSTVLKENKLNHVEPGKIGTYHGEHGEHKDGEHGKGDGHKVPAKPDADADLFE
ncbi:MAG: cytochrome C oxidase subunit IV family protein [Phycisphaeraceae bacterium]